MTPPKPGDFAGWVVGFPGPDVDYALCVDRSGDKALLRFQVFQRPGPWHEEWVHVTGSAKYGCWKAQKQSEIGPALFMERERIFPTIQEQDT
jgi:hypothetical protein